MTQSSSDSDYQQLIDLAKKVGDHLVRVHAETDIEKIVQTQVTDQNPDGGFRLSKAWSVAGDTIFVTDYGRLIIPASGSSGVIRRHPKRWRNRPHVEVRLYSHVKTPAALIQYRMKPSPPLEQIEQGLNRLLE